jgi:hypothetical protein
MLTHGTAEIDRGTILIRPSDDQIPTCPIPPAPSRMPWKTVAKAVFPWCINAEQFNDNSVNDRDTAAEFALFRFRWKCQMAQGETT